MKNIDESKLETDLAYRFAYVSEFIGFNEEDITVIHGAAELLAPLVDGLVDAVYDKLQQYDCTWRHFVPKQDGFDGETPTSVEDLQMNHPQIAFRKQHLAKYLVKLVSDPYDEKLLTYLDAVAKMHTGKAGNAGINVPFIQVNALMGFVSDALIATIITLPIPADAQHKAIRAFTKLLWIQTDLFIKHYMGE